MVRENVNNMKNKLACHSGQRQLLASFLLGDTYDQYSERTLSETLLVEQEDFNSSWFQKAWTCRFCLYLCSVSTLYWNYYRYAYIAFVGRGSRGSISVALRGRLPGARGSPSHITTTPRSIHSKLSSHAEHAQIDILKKVTY